MKQLVSCLLALALSALLGLGVVSAQENVLTRVAPSMMECYEDPATFERDNRLPMTMNMLIELVRKVEDTPGFQQDIRQLAISILHRFRQDGIVRATGVTNIPGVIPFSPTEFQFTKHRVLFSRLLPGNAVNFPNATLSTQERCALHFMLSNSIDRRVRGDENIRCSQLSQYRAARIPREGTNEMLAQPEMDRIRKQIKKFKKSARLEMDPDGEELADGEEPQEASEVEGRAGPEGAPEIDAAAAEEEAGEPLEEDGAAGELGDVSLVDIASNAISACPVENGVVYTPWGSVMAGTVMAGIAAGLEPQTVQLRDLVAPRAGEFRSRQQAQPMRVDNRWAATLAGDLAEVSLLHVPSQANNVQVGAAGAWNRTVAPRWYFLSQREHLQMTDTEIRAGIDGLLLATNVAEWRSRANGLRLSQLLDMYYSHRGIFNDTMRSCNRRDLFTTVAPMQQMRDQTVAFSTVLDKEMQMPFTVTQSAIANFADRSTDALANYIPTALNDLSCDATAIVMNDPSTIWRAASDLYIFIDAAWPYRDAYSVVSHILDSVDVGRFGTTYTILNARDGSVVVNTTQFLADFHLTYTPQLHESLPTGFNLPNVFRQLRNETNRLMSEERRNNSLSGRSKIALSIVHMDRVSEGDTNFAIQHLQIFREEVPDLRFLYLAAGDQGRFNRFVRDERRDVFALRELESGSVIDTVRVQLSPVILRILEEPRRVVNPRCGHDWNQENWGSNSMNQFVEPRGINFYRLHPNYFFQEGNNRRLRIQGHGFATLTVCQSRWVERPRLNTTENRDSIQCRTINTDAVDIDLSNACSGHSVIGTCPPLFVSVEGPQTPPAIIRCSEPECRFPDNARFAIVLDNMGCFSGASRTMSSLLMAAFAVVMLRFFK
ncbi:AGAP011476-PA-like protein [Anopheles sinensis]|uniref:AGAP011476-PA-like protein n=1 Tax=Anopheles sinensis TaxID=74873 RepID=A0A084WBC6_ANOSI|nr:AGAP011476-PA-like protein [Anopheles sinensis]